MAAGGGWSVILGGVALTGGDDPNNEALGCLTSPPAGLGLPPLRTQDVTFPQRDGVRHYSDWYEPRIITLENVMVCSDDCDDCPSARRKVRDIMKAWGRRCDDTELIILTDCNGEDEDSSLVGPFFVVGRPRVAEVTWLGQGSHCASLLLRFDAVDHRINILDPETGFRDCVTLTPQVESFCRTYPRCYEPDGMCYTVDQGTGGGPQTVNVTGTECVSLIITLNGALHDPTVENLTTGEAIHYNGTIGEDDEPVIIDTSNGTATQGGASRTHLITGNTRMQLAPGDNQLRLVSFNINDSGNAEACWSPAIVAI